MTLTRSLTLIFILLFTTTFNCTVALSREVRVPEIIEICRADIEAIKEMKLSKIPDISEPCSFVVSSTLEGFLSGVFASALKDNSSEWPLHCPSEKQIQDIWPESIVVEYLRFLAISQNSDDYTGTERLNYSILSFFKKHICGELSWQKLK